MAQISTTGSPISIDFAKLPLRDDNPSQIDLLGFSDIVRTIEVTITRPDLDPLTVGVNAPWGGGKTTVLHLLKKQLDERDDILVVYVSPWEYERTTDTKATLIGSVLESLKTELQGNQEALAKISEKLNKLVSRVNLAKAVTLAAKSAITMTLPSLDSLEGLFNEEDKATDPTLQGFRDEFEELLSSKELGHITRVVVLVDDLDRSLPDTVVETLEAIKLFLSVKKMAFVIAADEDNVARAIGQKLETTGQPTTARQYLEKMVQIPFRIPALSRERTEEYLALLILADAVNLTEISARLDDTRGNEESLLSRVNGLIEVNKRKDLLLAERLAPILHRHTQGNPRRLKRFLNALWLRTVFSQSRGVNLEADACAKLMVAELFFPDLFGQMLGWFAAGNLGEMINELETGDGDHADQAFEWGSLEPDVSQMNLPEYLLLAASLRGETVEEAGLPPELRDLATLLISDSETIRNGGLEAVKKLELAQKSTLARYIATQLRHQQSPQGQKVLAESLSGLSEDEKVAKTIAVEISLMEPSSIFAPVPIALLSRIVSGPIIEVVRRWSEDEGIRNQTRNAAKEALKGV